MHTSEQVRRAYLITREFGIPDEKTRPVLNRLRKDSGENWDYIESDNYSALIEAIYSAEEERQYQDSSHDIDTPHCEASCSSVQVVQKQPQARKRKCKKRMISDITKGTEKLEISLVYDDDDVGIEELPKFTYIPHNVSYQDAIVRVSIARVSDEDCCANCQGDCLSAEVPCNCACGRYAYNKEGLLKEEFLDTCLKMKKKEREKGTGATRDRRLIRKFIKECWRKCGCDMRCGNRVVQRGIKCGLQVYFTQEGKGWGVRTLQDLPKGTFVCEYIGEILTKKELYERNISSSSSKRRRTYHVTLNADFGSEKKDLKDEEALCLDATSFGNVSRFINHRCEDANLIDILVEIETPDRNYYHIAFFTSRDVKAMDELTWDYMIDFSDVKAFRCCCGSGSCRDKKSKGSRGKSTERRKFVSAKERPGTSNCDDDDRRRKLEDVVVICVSDSSPSPKIKKQREKSNGDSFRRRVTRGEDP